MKKKQFYPIIFLTCLTLVMIIVITPSSSIFGANTDWLSQHVNLADYIRKTMLETKSFFPDFAFNIGGGQNIYNISYYGLFRPDILIGCLIPGIAMKDIIITYMIINLVLSVNLTYIWLKRKQFSTTLCIVGAVLLLSSSVLFQSHRQIMFVDYMPGVLLALIAVDTYIKNQKQGLLIGAVVLIIANSYFFAISALLTIFTYYCFEMYRLKNLITFKKLCLFIQPLLIGVLICGILLIPTAYVMLENHQSSGGSLDLMSLVVPRGDFKALLYNAYGCGLGFVAWAGLVLSLKLKETRKLSIWLLLLLFIPIFSFVLNGFLYPRAKILLPFTPLIIYVVIQTINEYKQSQIKLDLKLIVLLILPIVLFYKEPLVILDIIICLVGILLYLRITERTLYLLLVMPLIISYVNNQKESFVTKDTYQQVSNLKNIKVEKDGRYDIFKQSLNTVNQVSNNELRSSIYSSVSNRLYNHFYYDIIKNPISIKNRVACLSNSNIFFQGMMGVKTLYSENVVPMGYQAIGNNLYQNDKVLPLVYATSNSYDVVQFDRLDYPQTLDTIYNNVVVAGGQSTYQSKAATVALETVVKEKSDKLQITKLNDGYRINTKKTGKLELGINQDLTNKILIVEFDLAKVKLIKRKDTSITINGVKNKLSSSSAAYPNHNTHFTYVLSQNELLDQLSISFSNGRYDLKNIKVSTIDYDVIKNRNQEIDALVGSYNQDGNLVEGTINVSNDGYLVTSLPYQNGYTVLIDGKEVAKECVNKAFVGAKISKGQHQIRIIFKAPMKNVGYVCSGVGFIWLVFQGRRKKNEKGFERIN